MTTARLNRDQLFQSQAVNTLRRPGVAADFAAGLDFNIFNVSGLIEIHYMFGIVTNLFGAGVSIPQIQFTPTGGIQVALSGAHAGLNAAAAGTVLTWTGLTAGALTSGAALGMSDVNANSDWDGGFITIPAGIIAITNAVADATGVVDWYIAYVPHMAATIVTLL